MALLLSQCPKSKTLVHTHLVKLSKDEAKVYVRLQAIAKTSLAKFKAAQEQETKEDWAVSGKVSILAYIL